MSSSPPFPLDLSSYRQEASESENLTLHETIPKQAEKLHSSDVDRLYLALGFFFGEGNDGELEEQQLRSAQETFLEAVNRRHVSPIVAFYQAISTSAHAQEMDMVYAHHGGIHFYVYNILDRCGWHIFVPGLWDQFKQAASQRKVQEIKKLMGINQAEEKIGDQAKEAGQFTVVVGQGCEAKAEKFGGKEELKKDAMAETMAKPTMGDAINCQGSEFPKSG